SFLARPDAKVRSLRKRLQSSPHFRAGCARRPFKHTIKVPAPVEPGPEAEWLRQLNYLICRLLLSRGSAYRTCGGCRGLNIDCLAVPAEADSAPRPKRVRLLNCPVALLPEIDDTHSRMNEAVLYGFRAGSKLADCKVQITVDDTFL